MADTQLDIQLELDADGPRRTALEVAIRSAIRSGRLAEGTALPSSRAMAVDLGLSRSTVVAAYEQLNAEGYLRAEHGSATRVARFRAPPAVDDDPDPFGPAPLHDFRPGEPDASSFPRTRWLRSVKRVTNGAPDSAFGYPDPRGAAEFRSTLAGYLGRTRSVEADQGAIRVVGGYAAGLGFVAEMLRHRGVERIGVEDPTLPMHVQLLRAAGLRTVPVAVDEGGVDVDRLRASDVGAVVVTPAHQYPTGATLGSERRTALVDWARERNAWIIEDDYDGEYRYDRRPVGALQGLGPDRVIYVGTASKSLTPAVRLGWMVVPEPLRADLMRVTNLRSMVSTIDQLALTDFIERGDFDRHVRQMRVRYRRRSDALRSMLAEVAPWLALGDGAAGLHVMARIATDRLDEATILTASDAASVGLFGLMTHHRSTAAGPGFSIGFSRPSEHHFPTALERLAGVLAALRPAPSLPRTWIGGDTGRRY